MDNNSIYANRVEVDTSVYDFVFTFYQTVPAKNEDGKIETEERVKKCQIIMSPQHAKAFLNVLLGQINWYEQNYGKINLEPKKDNK